MSHHRRNLASPPLEPTHHKQPPTSTTKPHTDPPSYSVQNISNRFSKLHLDHQKSRAAKPVVPVIPVSDSSTTAVVSLTKSNSQRQPTTAEIGRRLNRVLTGPKPESKHDNNRGELQFDDNDDQLERQEIKREILSSSKIIITAGKKKKKKNKEEGERGPGGAAMGIGRRRSFCCTQNEVDDFLACNGVKVVSVDMPAFMQIHAVDCARKTVDSLEKFTAKTLALTLKKEFDGVYGPAWHCIVGSSFGSFVTHSVGGFLYFSMDHKLYVLLFKTTVQRAQQHSD